MKALLFIVTVIFVNFFKENFLLLNCLGLFAQSSQFTAINKYSAITGREENFVIGRYYIGLIQVKEEGWTGFSEGW